MDIEQIGKEASTAARILRSLGSDQRKQALININCKILENIDLIIKENAKDLSNAHKSNLSDAMIDRLTLNQASIKQIAKSVLDIANQDEVVGQITSEHKRDDGLLIQKQRIPLGVILMVFESRPNVVIDCSALAIKSGNAMILKGGKEAYYSNMIFGKIIKEGCQNILPNGCITVLASNDRSTIEKLLTLKEHIDVVIPRGGEKLINYVYDNAKIPVIAHFKGLCHLYIHNEADQEKAKQICLNSKTQRPGVCNALETLLIDKNINQDFVIKLIKDLKEKKVEIRGCQKLTKLIPNIISATDQDWDTEYLEKILSIKIVDDHIEAIGHINQHGSFHTEAIVSENEEVINQFVSSVDASCIMVNASTRFNDGGELGLGAEIGISTTKFHAYGPMGAEELTTTRYLVTGNGHTRV